MTTAGYYAEAIRLLDPFVPLQTPEGTSDDEARRQAMDWLLAERALTAGSLPADADHNVVIRNLLTVRRPADMPSLIYACLDQVFAARTRARGAVGPDSVRSAPGSTATIGSTTAKVWRGDITRLSVDAIVNAANTEFLGCFRPGHACIDNAIHSAAGPRLREDCARIIEIQGSKEPTGDAKIARAYHLPSRFVVHTVGPIVQAGRVGPDDERALVSSYRACLELAASIPSIRTLAFCAISTGVFGYPKESAAATAVQAVSAWVSEHEGAFDLVVFNVFSDADEAAYERAMAGRGKDQPL